MDCIKLLKDLIKINTTNPPGNEMNLLWFLKKIIDQDGIECVLQYSAKDRGNLLACLPATVQEKPPLFLISHADVVPADRQEWKYPPFAAEEHDGYIYGRGSVDTKQLTVMELDAFLNLHHSIKKRKRDVYFLVTSDEERGSQYGLQYFLKNSLTVNGTNIAGKERFKNADVISEGGGFPVIVGGKTFYLCETGQKSCGTVTFTIKTNQSASPWLPASDAMIRAMRLIQDIGSQKVEVRTLSTVKNFESKLSGAPMSDMMQNILAAMKSNTITVTKICGSDSNMVTVTCDVRLLPGTSKAGLVAMLERLSEKYECEYKILSLSEGYETDPDTAMIQILDHATKSALSDNDAEIEILPFVSMGSSDGRFLVPSDCRVYGYSPVYAWDMTFDEAVSMIHSKNERIHRDSVKLGCRILTEAVSEASV